jgi:NAD(P)-dependent dehydrogenase (short-subunit alcohol dehydrogenase family)
MASVREAERDDEGPWRWSWATWIRANAILPGWIDTPMTERTLRWDRFVERVLPRVPARRGGVPGDFGAIAVHLASDAGAYHTGDTFVIDGDAVF